jgi:hypothetical protein
MLKLQLAVRWKSAACYTRAWAMCDGLALPGKLAVGTHRACAVAANDDGHVLLPEQLRPHHGALAARNMVLDILAPATVPTVSNVLEPELAAFAICYLGTELDAHLAPLMTAPFSERHARYTGTQHWRATGTEGSCQARNYCSAMSNNCRFCAHMLLQRGLDWASFLDGSALRGACMIVQPTMVAFALLHGTDPNRTDIAGCAPLHHLANSQYRTGRSRPQQVESDGTKETYQGTLLVARMLQMAGADLEVVDHYGATPLYSACAVDNPAAAKALLLLGAKTDVVPRQHDTDSPLPPLAELCRTFLQAGPHATAQIVLEAMGTAPRPLLLGPGVRVLLDGLNTVALNGQRGTCLGTERVSGRCMIQLDQSGRAPIKVKPENVLPLDGRLGWRYSGFELLASRAMTQGVLSQAALDRLTDAIASGAQSEAEAAKHIRELCQL